MFRLRPLRLPIIYIRTYSVFADSWYVSLDEGGLITASSAVSCKSSRWKSSCTPLNLHGKAIWEFYN